MMVNFLKGTLPVLVILELSGCSYIKSFLPDKEKDYHYSQEIPPLKVPADLSSEHFETYQETLVTEQTESLSLQDQQSDGELDTVSETVTEKTAVTEEIDPQVVDPENQAMITDVATQTTVAGLSQSDALTDPSDIAAAAADSVSSTTEKEGQQDPWDITLDDRETPLPDQGFDQPDEATETTADGSQLSEVEQPQQTLVNDSVQTQSSATEVENMTQGSVPPVPLSESALENQKVRYLEFNDGSQRIQIDENVSKSWRLVGKAISHNAIEITGRYREQLQYVVQYEPSDEPYVDGSIWDEFVFFFSGDQRQEREYHVQLVDGVSKTEVLVNDENDFPVMEGDGILLLQILYKTIKAELESESLE